MTQRLINDNNIINGHTFTVRPSKRRPPVVQFNRTSTATLSLAPPSGDLFSQFITSFTSLIASPGPTVHSVTPRGPNSVCDMSRHALIARRRTRSSAGKLAPKELQTLWELILHSPWEPLNTSPGHTGRISINCCPTSSTVASVLQFTLGQHG